MRFESVLLVGGGQRADGLKDLLTATGRRVQYISKASAFDAAFAPVDLFIFAPDISDFDGGAEADRTLCEKAYEALPLSLMDMAALFYHAAPNARICAATWPEASINLSAGTEGFALPMALAAMNMFLKLLFNKLRPRGITFRVCCAKSPTFLYEYFLRDQSFEADNPKHSDEERLVLRGENGMEMPW